MSDNATAINYINNMGGTRSAICNIIPEEIWTWCAERNLWISAAFIPGRENANADEASRKFYDNLEWKLSTNVFKIITNRFGLPTIDLFTSRNIK